ncbi:MAG: holo-ACP synthase [Nitrospirales bacterium]|nr:holo-ACP synthase [Nitrospirales bacterium]
MSIVGIGLDLVNIARLEAIARRWQDRFLQRVYTEDERRASFGRAWPYASLAGRFAAKEAMLKALGTGWSAGVSWQDIQVLNEAGGRPVATVQGRTGVLVQQAGVTRIHVSLSHDGGYAIAEVILTDETQ